MQDANREATKVATENVKIPDSKLFGGRSCVLLEQDCAKRGVKSPVYHFQHGEGESQAISTVKVHVGPVDRLSVIHARARANDVQSAHNAAAAKALDLMSAVDFTAESKRQIGEIEPRADLTRGETCPPRFGTSVDTKILVLSKSSAQSPRSPTPSCKVPSPHSQGRRMTEDDNTTREAAVHNSRSIIKHQRIPLRSILLRCLLLSGMRTHKIARQPPTHIKMTECESITLVRTNQKSRLARIVSANILLLQVMRIPPHGWDARKQLSQILFDHRQDHRDLRTLELIFDPTRDWKLHEVRQSQGVREHSQSRRSLRLQRARVGPLLDSDSISESDDYSTDSSDSNPQDLAWRIRVMNDLMSTFCNVFYTILRGQIQRNARTYIRSRNSGSKSSAAPTSGSSRTSNAGARKRKRGDADDDDDDDSRERRSGDDGNKRRLAGRDSFGLAAASVRFACPFYKRNPARYISSRSCPGPGWDDVHRVKEHLYRCHALRSQCERCGLEFDNDNLLTGHRRSPVPCDVRDFPHREGVTLEQKLALRSRKRVKQDESEEEKWYRAYAILFRYDDDTAYPSPYYELDMLKQSTLSPYHEFLRVEMAPQMQQQLALEMEQELIESPEGIDERLRRRLPSIVHSVHRRIFRMFENARRAVQMPDWPTPPASETIPGPSPFDTISDGAQADFVLDQWFPMDDSTFTFDDTSMASRSLGLRTLQWRSRRKQGPKGNLEHVHAVSVSHRGLSPRRCTMNFKRKTSLRDDTPRRY